MRRRVIIWIASFLFSVTTIGLFTWGISWAISPVRIATEYRLTVGTQYSTTIYTYKFYKNGKFAYQKRTISNSNQISGEEDYEGHYTIKDKTIGMSHFGNNYNVLYLSDKKSELLTNLNSQGRIYRSSFDFTFVIFLGALICLIVTVYLFYHFVRKDLKKYRN